MSSHRNTRRTLSGLTAVAIISLASACGGSDEASAPDDVSSVPDDVSSVPDDVSSVPDDVSSVPASDLTEQTAGESAVEPSEDETTPDSEPAASPPAASGGQGSATLSLANGETMEFSVRCALKPQEVAGSEILFTASSPEAPFLDITQFGSEGIVTDNSSISVFGADFDTLWEANSFFDAFGGSIELSLDGSTITGSGTFFPGGDIEETPVDGTIVANC